jgi:hypothetical protein
VDQLDQDGDGTGTTCDAVRSEARTSGRSRMREWTAAV